MGDWFYQRDYGLAKMRSKANYINPETFQLMLEHIPDLKIRKWKDKDVEMLFKICYWCILRINEGVRLEKEYFDLESKEVYLGRTKTKKGDYAPIPDVFVPELSDYLATKKDGKLFPNCNRQIVYIWLKRLGVMLNIAAFTTPQSETGEKTVTHIYRKSIGKDMIYGTHGKKAPLNVVQKQLRHSSLVTTSKYLNVDIESVKEWWNPPDTKDTNETTD